MILLLKINIIFKLGLLNNRTFFKTSVFKNLLLHSLNLYFLNHVGSSYKLFSFIYIFIWYIHNIICIPLQRGVYFQLEVSE